MDKKILIPLPVFAGLVAAPIVIIAVARRNNKINDRFVKKAAMDGAALDGIAKVLTDDEDWNADTTAKIFRIVDRVRDVNITH